MIVAIANVTRRKLRTDKIASWTLDKFFPYEFYQKTAQCQLAFASLRKLELACSS